MDHLISNLTHTCVLLDDGSELGVWLLTKKLSSSNQQQLLETKQTVQCFMLRI